MSISKEKKNSLIKSVGVVSSATALSRVFGLVREQVMAYYFGAGMATDAFLTAFRIPNLLRDMFAEGALSSAFVPVFKEKMVNQSDDEAFKLANIVFTAIFIVVGFIVLLGIIAAPAIIYISAHGFTDIVGKFDLTVNLTRIMFFYLLLVSLSALVMGILNSFGRFGIPAISPALFNLGIIVPVVVFYGFFDQPVYVLAIGVLIGGLAQLAIQIPALLKIGYRFKPSFDFLNEGLKRVINLLLPMIAGMSAGRVNILVNTLLASFLMEGSISFLSYSYRLMHFPLGVFAVALGTVALPKVSALAIRNDFKGLKKTFDEALGLNLFVIIPSGVFLVLMGRELVDLIFMWGAFTEKDAANTSLSLLHYSYGLIGFATVRVVVPFYYAFSDSRLPMKFSIISVVVNIALYYPLISILNFAGLAAATSVSALLNAVLLLYYLPTKGVNYSANKLLLNIFKMVVSAFLAFYTAKLIPIKLYTGTSEILSRVEALFIPLISACIIYLVLCFVFRVDVLNLLLRKVFKKDIKNV